MAIDTEERTDNKQDNKGGKQKNNNKKVLTIVLVVIGVLVVLSILGTLLAGFVFKKGAETFIGQMTDGQVKLDTNQGGGEFTFKDEDGSETSTRVGSNVELHKDFPKNDVPIYKDATIVASSSATVADGAKTYIVSLSTKDNFSDVVKFYKNAFSAEGWTESYSMDSDNNNSMAHYVNEAKSLKVVVSIQHEDDDRETTIMLTVNTGE